MLQLNRVSYYRVVHRWQRNVLVGAFARMDPHGRMLLVARTMAGGPTEGMACATFHEEAPRAGMWMPLTGRLKRRGTTHDGGPCVLVLTEHPDAGEP